MQGESKALIRLTLEKPEISTGSMGHLARKIFSFFSHGLGGHCLNTTYISMDLEPCFKIHSLACVYPENIKLGQMTTLNVISHVVVSDYRLG